MKINAQRGQTEKRLQTKAIERQYNIRYKVMNLLYTKKSKRDE